MCSMLHWQDQSNSNLVYTYCIELMYVVVVVCHLITKIFLYFFSFVNIIMTLLNNFELTYMQTVSSIVVEQIID
jgi:hypothetical protein